MCADEFYWLRVTLYAETSWNYNPEADHCNELCHDEHQGRFLSDTLLSEQQNYNHGDRRCANALLEHFKG